MLIIISYWNFSRDYLWLETCFPKDLHQARGSFLLQYICVSTLKRKIINYNSQPALLSILLLGQDSVTTPSNINCKIFHLCNCNNKCFHVYVSFAGNTLNIHRDFDKKLENSKIKKQFADKKKKESQVDGHNCFLFCLPPPPTIELSMDKKKLPTLPTCHQETAHTEMVFPPFCFTSCYSVAF